MDNLTPIQEESLVVIDHYIEEHSESPTRQELSKMLGQKSTNGVNQILEALRKKGYIRLDPPRRKRNIVVLRRPHKQMDLFDKDNEA
jgi:SOS-response transcriptional repressor LexA